MDNRLSGKKNLLRLGKLMVILAVSGCLSPPVMAAPQQLIVKFKPNTITCDAAGIAQLSSATQIALEYVRPMSGDACVIRQLDGADNFLRGQQLLRQHPAVEWLEQDAKKRAL